MVFLKSSFFFCLYFFSPKGSASEATLVALLVAKEKTVDYVKEFHPEKREADIKGRLVAYASGWYHKIHG